MNKTALISIALLLCAAEGVRAQGLLRYDNVQERNFGLQGTNAVMMRGADSVTISYARVGGTYSWGENRLSSDAPRQWSAGAEAKTIVHLDKMSMNGSFGFRQTMSYDACGSMFVSPGRFPVDLIEFTPGRKSRQRYFFTGGISVDLSPRVRLGGDIGFDATNYAKMKDLRYLNYAMDLHLRPGLQYIVNSDISLGATFIFERSSESIAAEQIGQTVEPYSVFLDKGLHYGLLQDWQGSGVHLAEAGINRFPLTDMGYGAGLQAFIGAFYIDLSYVRSNGKIGEKDAIWYIFPSSRGVVKLAWKGKSSKGTEHIIRLDACYDSSSNSESVMDKVTSSGVTVRKIFGYNPILSNSTFSIAPCWKAVSYGSWEASAGVDYTIDASLGTMMYPYINALTLNTFRIYGSALKYFGSFSAAFRLGLSRGFADEATRLSPTYTLEPMQSPFRLEEYYDNWKWYNTASGLDTALSLRYDFPIRIYLGLDASWSKRGKLSRTSLGIFLGYTF